MRGGGCKIDVGLARVARSRGPGEGEERCFNAIIPWENRGNLENELRKRANGSIFEAKPRE